MYGVFKEVQAGRRGDKVRLTDLFLRIVSQTFTRLVVVVAVFFKACNISGFKHFLRTLRFHFLLMYLSVIFSLYTIFSSQNYPYNQIAQWVFAAIQPEGKSDIIFSEMVHMVAFFVMLAQKELMKFLFHAVDTDNKQYLRYDSI